MLKNAAERLKEGCRCQDVLARWGGDEFLILMPNTGGTEAVTITKKISALFRETAIKDIPLSISLGLATGECPSGKITDLIKEAEDSMYKQKLTESKSTKSAVLGALLKTLAAKSYETETHTRNMSAMAIKIGEQAGLPESELKRLELLITLHDIGKINVPEEILVKDKPLTNEEWEVIKKHPETGYRIAMATEEFSHVAEDILCHHERWDGTGYPRGLTGESIPLLARITAVADACEVMMNGRPYKKAMTLKEIKNELRVSSGSHFEPWLVSITLQLLENEQSNFPEQHGSL
jgi:HD-GYP domain-containing protein (c-di-GMP phosphodiesterase class II)